MIFLYFKHFLLKIFSIVNICLYKNLNKIRKEHHKIREDRFITELGKKNEEEG